MKQLFEFDEHIGDWRVLVQSKDIQDAAIQTRHIAPEAVTTDKIHDGAVTTPKIQDNAVVTDKIHDGAVTTPKIADKQIKERHIDDDQIKEHHIDDKQIKSRHIDDDQILSDHIDNKQVITRHIADNAVTNDKLSGVEDPAGPAVTEGKIAPKAVTADKIDDGAVLAGNIAPGAVDNSKLADNSVIAGNIAAGAVENRNIQDNAVTTDKLSDASSAAGAAVTAAKIADGNVTTSKIQNNAVTTDKLSGINDPGGAAVTEDKLAPGAVTTDKLAPEVISQLQTITDAVPTKDSVKPMQSGGVLLHGSALDISELCATENPHKPATFEDLSAALTALAALPATYRKGGMSIKYEQTPDNKYVQFRYMETDATTVDTFTDPTNWQGVDENPTLGSKNLVESGGVHKVEYYINEKYQGFINTDKWADIGTGNRYYSIIPIDINKGETVIIKGSANGTSVVCLLSEYNPVEGANAGVVDTFTANQNTESSYTASNNAHYLYVLAESSGNSRIPQKLEIGPTDILALAKDNILRLKKYVDNNVDTLATKQELSSKSDIYNTFLKSDKIVVSDSKSVTGSGNVVILDFIANGGDTIKFNISGKGTVWSGIRIYPIKDGTVGANTSFTVGEFLYTIPEGGVTQLRINISGSKFIAAGTIIYTVSFLGISAEIAKINPMYNKVVMIPEPDNIAEVEDKIFNSGSVEITQDGNTDFFVIDDADIKKGDRFKITVSGLGTVINKYRVYFVDGGTATVYDESPVVITAPVDTTFFRMGIGSSYFIASGTVEWSVVKLGVNSVFDELEKEIDEIEPTVVNDILTRNADVDDVVYAGGWTNVYANKQQIKLFSLLMSGDIHGRAVQMQSIVDYLNAKSFIDAGIMLGDLAGSNYTSDFSFYPPIVEQVNKPFITIAGNHDMGSEEDPSLNAPSMEAFYNRYYAPTIQYAGTISHPSGKCYFYKDFADYGIRIIMLNQYDYPDADLQVVGYQKGLAMYSQAQIDWFISVLNSTPAYYGVIVALHMTPDKMIPYDCDFTSRNFRGKQSFAAGSSTISGDIIADIVNAWISGGTLNEDYTITVTSALTGLTATADFTSRGEGEFICYIGGHWHNDIISHDFKYPTQLMLTVNNAACVARESDMPRLEGSKSEDSFFIISVDRTNKKVNIVSIGARMANDMVKRESIRLSY